MNILAKIAAYKREEVAADKLETSLSELERMARRAGRVRGFYQRLRQRRDQGVFGLIAEIKKASPSKGLIRADFAPPRLARAYQSGGATCLSVLTDKRSFQGDKTHLGQARAACTLPVLRKDFLIDPYQVTQSRALGADCILIILGLVEDQLAGELEACAVDWQMDVLLEVHDADELERALKLESPLIGINNRDLKTFDTNLETTEVLARNIPQENLVVGESGLNGPEDLARLARCGVTTFLIGESLMREADIATATRNILARAREQTALGGE